jgi:uncharacterized protein YdaT
LTLAQNGQKETRNIGLANNRSKSVCSEDKKDGLKNSLQRPNSTDLTAASKQNVNSTNNNTHHEEYSSEVQVLYPINRGSNN